jgi:hypothetical protein
MRMAQCSCQLQPPTRHVFGPANVWRPVAGANGEGGACAASAKCTVILAGPRHVCCCLLPAVLDPNGEGGARLALRGGVVLPGARRW